MVLNKCRFCDHSNPDDAKFCSECGGCLHLLPCPSCGAVTDVAATTCYQCHAQLSVRPNEAVVAAAAPQPVQSTPRWRMPVIVGSAVLAAISALAYYGYRQGSWVNGLHPPGAGVRSGITQPAVPASLATETSPAGARPAAANPSNAGPKLKPQESGPAKTIAAPASASPPLGAIGAAEVEPPGVCADAVAALGLCSATTPPVTHTGRRE